MSGMFSKRTAKEDQRRAEMNYLTMSSSTEDQGGKPKFVPTHHNLFHPSDPADPQNWPFWKKVHATVCSWLAVFTLLYATTVPTLVIPLLPMALDTTPTLAKFAFTAPFFGVFFAPIFTPHVSERVGRKWFYVLSMSLFLIFVGAISAATTINQLIILRVFAGLVGGPMVVLIEGTHADVWPARKTVSYYCSIALSQYWGAAFGAVIGAQALKMGVPWTAYSALIIGGVSWLVLLTMPETYPRQILRSHGVVLPKALSGVSFSEMADVTIIKPICMVIEPIVVMSAYVLGLAFATVFQWFIVVPFVLENVYGYDEADVGVIFLSAAAGAAMSFATSLVLDRGSMKIEWRMLPAMLGVFLTMASLFWVAWTAKPTIPSAVPIVGTAVYVWGNMSILLSLVSYFFDAFPPAGTLSALTFMACFRITCAGILPIFILNIFANVTPPWALSILGFLHVLAIPVPFIIFFFGERLRERSPYSAAATGEMSVVAMQAEEKKEEESMAMEESS